MKTEINTKNFGAWVSEYFVTVVLTSIIRRNRTARVPHV